MRIAAALVTASLLSASSTLASVQFADTTLDTAQEVPTPTGAPGAGGTATFMFDDETNALTYTVTVHDLSGAPIAGHIHQAPPGTAGGIIVGLPSIPTSPNGTATGTLTIPNAADVQALFNEGFYINLHTTLNPNGEIRGQIRPVKGSCSCKTAVNHGKFVSCVKKAIKGLTKQEKQEALIKALKQFAPKSSCGKKPPKKTPKNTVACCLPATPENNIVTGRLCAQVSQSKCNSLLGSNSGASCLPTTPCEPPASPSGAFLEDWD